MSDVQREERPLAVGDTIAARPCVVTIEQVTNTSAYGHCATCDDRHIIDRFRYEQGDGPWQPVEHPGRHNATDPSSNEGDR